MQVSFCAFIFYPFPKTGFGISEFTIITFSDGNKHLFFRDSIKLDDEAKTNLIIKKRGYFS